MKEMLISRRQHG